MIHTFSMNHLNFVVDGNSGSIHVVDDVGFDIIRDKQELPCVDDVVKSLCNQYKKADIIDAFTEIDLLIKEGSLFTPESKLKAAAALKPEHSGIKALCLHVSHDCNLRCEYCFASKGDYQTGRKLMPEDVALKATDYLVEQSGHRHTIEIDFFGGEPLLNFETVKAVVAYGRELEHHTGKRFYFTITTNATLLNDERIDFINEHMDNLGSHSGRDGEKLKAIGAKLGEAIKINAPILDDCPVNIECTIVDSLVTGSHHMFVGKVEYVHATEALVKENGDLDFVTMEFL